MIFNMSETETQSGESSGYKVVVASGTDYYVSATVPTASSTTTKTTEIEPGSTFYIWTDFAQQPGVLYVQSTTGTLAESGSGTVTERSTRRWKSYVMPTDNVCVYYVVNAGVPEEDEIVIINDAEELGTAVVAFDTEHIDSIVVSEYSSLNYPNIKHGALITYIFYSGFGEVVPFDLSTGHSVPCFYIGDAGDQAIYTFLIPDSVTAIELSIIV